MGYKREDIYGVTPLDIKKLNDNTKSLWLKIFGNLDFADFSDPLKKEFISKIGKDEVYTLIAQTEDEIMLSANNAIDTAIIDLKANEISMMVKSGEIISAINQSAETIKILASKIELQGYVTMTDLLGAGKTEINGSNITTGSINANLIKTGSLSADIIQSGTMSADRISGGSIDGNLITGSLSGLSTVISQEISGYYVRFTENDTEPDFTAGLQVGGGYWSGGAEINSIGEFNGKYVGTTGNIYAGKDISCGGYKYCIQDTYNYGRRGISAYETAEYYFGDLGYGTIGADGECVISIDEIFQECVNVNIPYHVFVQAYNGSVLSIDRQAGYFIVRGSEGTEFSWEIKAKRLGYEHSRLELFEENDGVAYSNIELELNNTQLLENDLLGVA